MKGKFIPGPWEISEQKERRVNSMVWNTLKLFGAEGRRRSEPVRELPQIRASLSFFTSCSEPFETGQGRWLLQAAGSWPRNSSCSRLCPAAQSAEEMNM